MEKGVSLQGASARNEPHRNILVNQVGVVCNRLGLCPLWTHLSSSPRSDGYALGQAANSQIHPAQDSIREHFQRLDSSETQ